MVHSNNSLLLLCSSGSFLIGVITGFYLRHRLTGVNNVDSFRVLAALLITVLWSVSVLADIFIVDYAAPYMMYILMSIVAGFFFGSDVVEKVFTRRIK